MFITLIIKKTLYNINIYYMNDCFASWQGNKLVQYYSLNILF